MILPKSHTLIFMWYLWALDKEAQGFLRPFMEIMIDPDCHSQIRDVAYKHLDFNMTQLAKLEDISAGLNTRDGG